MISTPARVNIALFYCLIEKTSQGLKLFQDSLNVSTGCIMIIFIKKSFLFTPTINDLIDAWGIYLSLEVQEGAFNRWLVFKIERCKLILITVTSSTKLLLLSNHLEIVVRFFALGDCVAIVSLSLF